MSEKIEVKALGKWHLGEIVEAMGAKLVAYKIDGRTQIGRLSRLERKGRIRRTPAAPATFRPAGCEFDLEPGTITKIEGTDELRRWVSADRKEAWRNAGWWQHLPANLVWLGRYERPATAAEIADSTITLDDVPASLRGEVERIRARRKATPVTITDDDGEAEPAAKPQPHTLATWPTEAMRVRSKSSDCMATIACTRQEGVGAIYVLASSQVSGCLIRWDTLADHYEWTDAAGKVWRRCTIGGAA